MAEYTYKDVIIDPDDSRVEIGAKYYFALGAQACIDKANNDSRGTSLQAIDRSREYCPFISDDEKDYPFIIRKKEPEKKYVPFDLSLEEDRAKLREAWIRPKGRPSVGLKIIAMNIDCVFFHGEKGQSTEDLLMEYEFIDGTPCGKLEEVEG